MSGQHTPGPWFADGNEIRCRFSPDTLPVMVARFAGNNDEALANAKLAAAAPDLLEALELITDQLERVGDTRPGKDGDFIDAARAAIAKATGGQS